MESFKEICMDTHPLSVTCWQMELHGVLSFIAPRLLAESSNLLLGKSLALIFGHRLVPKSVFKWILICARFVNISLFSLLLKESNKKEN
jgi:hypothetical protein